MATTTPAPPQGRPATKTASTAMVMLEQKRPQMRAVAARVKAEAMAERDTLVAGATGLGLGLLERYQVDYPAIPGVDKSVTPALALYVAGRWSGNRDIKAAARAAIAIAAYRIGAGGKAGVSGDDGDEVISGSL